MVNRANVGSGTGRLFVDAEPNSCVNLLSLYKHRARLVVEVARNLGVPAVVVCAGWEWMVEEKVSIVLAVR